MAETFYFAPYIPEFSFTGVTERSFPIQQLFTDILKNFENLTVKHLCRSPFFNNVAICRIVFFLQSTSGLLLAAVAWIEIKLCEKNANSKPWSFLLYDGKNYILQQ